MIQVLVVDDHAIVREGWKQILGETDDIRVAGEASNAHEAMEQIHSRKWDAVVLDIAMPGTSGLSLLKTVKEIRPELPVLMMSVYTEDQYAIRVLKAGASGFMNKDTDPGELVKAIRKVYSGRKYVSGTLAEKLACLYDENHESPLHERLTDKEFQVLCMIGAGMSGKDIAEELSRSEKTVSTWRRRILVKMGLSSTRELIQYALKHDLAD